MAWPVVSYYTINGFPGDKPTPYVPAGFDGAPETPSQAVARAGALLAEEGRWATGNWFVHDNPLHPEYADNPYCNGWGACAEGALALVTIGALWVDPREDPCDEGDCEVCRGMWQAPSTTLGPAERNNPTPERVLFTRARSYVEKAIGDLYGYERSYIPRFNDRKGGTRSDVLDVFAEAQRLAERDEQTTTENDK